MNLRQLGAMLRARWGLALSVWLAVVGATVAASLIIPPQYTAVASLGADVKPDPIAGAYPGLVATSYVTTQVDVIQSERVARRVVRNLRLAENAAMRAQWQDETQGKVAFEQWLTDSFAKRLEVRPSRDSNVVQVAYRAHEARLAAAMANGFVQAYLDTALELRVDPARQFSSFFDQRSREARQALTEAQTKLSSQQRSHGLIANDERIDVENARLAELSSQVVVAQAQASDSGSRLQEVGARVPEELPEVLASSLLAGLKVDLTRQQARLKELGSRLGEDHPQHQEMASGIRELQARIAAETARVTGGIAAADAINRERLSRLQAALAAQRQRVLAMKAARDEAAVLMRDVEGAQRAYDAVVGRLQLTSLESQSTQGQSYWLSQAAPPAEPSSPKLVLNTVLAVFVGALLSVLAVLWLENLARHRRTGPSKDASEGAEA